MSERFVPPDGPCYSDLRGKTALVTGGGSGIGQMISLRLAAEGMHVMLCGLEENTLLQTADLIRGRDGTAWPYAVNLARREEIERMWQVILQQQSAPDLFVHNAALMVDKPPEQLDADWWRLMFATNADSGYYLAKLCLEAMIPRRSGNIVFISSVGSIRPHYTLEAYDATKAAIDSLTRSLAIEMGRHGVRVNSIAPGAIQTKWNLPEKPDSLPGVPLKELEQPLIPMGRCGVSAEIASVVAFLASRQSSYLTGQNICVDGGVVMQVCPRGMWI